VTPAAKSLSVTEEVLVDVTTEFAPFFHGYHHDFHWLSSDKILTQKRAKLTSVNKCLAKVCYKMSLWRVNQRKYAGNKGRAKTMKENWMNLATDHPDRNFSRGCNKTQAFTRTIVSELYLQNF